MQIEDLPIEIQAKIIEFAVKEDQEELYKIEKISPSWKMLTTQICFWQPIFGEICRKLPETIVCRKIYT